MVKDFWLWFKATLWTPVVFSPYQVVTVRNFIEAKIRLQNEKVYSTTPQPVLTLHLACQSVGWASVYWPTEL